MNPGKEGSVVREGVPCRLLWGFFFGPVSLLYGAGGMGTTTVLSPGEATSGV